MDKSFSQSTKSGLEGAFLLTSLATGGDQSSYWGVMGQDICAGLSDAGETCRLFGPDSPGCQELLQSIVLGNRSLGYSLGFNLMPDILAPTKESVWAIAKVPLIISCLDHPTHLYDRLARVLGLTKDQPGLPPRHIGIMEDRHRECLLDLGWPSSLIFTFSQGGPPPAPAPIPYAHRNRSVLFFGTIGTPVSHEVFLGQVGWESQALRTALGEAIEETLEGTDDVYSICKRKFLSFGFPLQSTGKITVLVDRRARTLRRFRMLESLTGIDINVYGKVEAEAARRLSHCTFHGEVDFESQRALTRQARIVLNDAINLRDSALIRAFYTMAEGTVLATEMNDFFQAHFMPVNGVIPLGKPWQETASLLKDRLDDTNALQTIADAALAHYTTSHQWTSRLPGLLSVLGQIARA